MPALDRAVQLQTRVRFHNIHTSLSSLNLVALFPWPASGTQISTFSCRAVSASLKKPLAWPSFICTVGSPFFPPGPQYLSTVFVRKRCVAT